MYTAMVKDPCKEWDRVDIFVHSLSTWATLKIQLDLDIKTTYGSKKSGLYSKVVFISREQNGETMPKLYSKWASGLYTKVAFN